VLDNFLSLSKEESTMLVDKRVSLSLLVLRFGVFIVMFMWTLDKFVNPAHAMKVYAVFYFLKGLDATTMYVIAAVEMIIIIGFLLGYLKTLTYGAVLVFHAISTFSSYKQYLAPYADGHLMFFAAWPMLAASFALFYLRDKDTKWTMGK
jgi:putative oxidoreductase